MTREPGEDDLVVHVVLPRAEVLGIDIVAITLGNPLSVILGEALAGALLEAPFEMLDPASGKTHDVFAIAVPPRTGLVVPLGKYGQVGIGNEDGHLAVAVPAAVKGLTERAMAPLILHGKARSMGARPAGGSFTGAMAVFHVDPQPGTEWMLAFFGIRIGFLFP